MLNRLGIILIISGFLLLWLKNEGSQAFLNTLVYQCLVNWPVFLIVIGFILTQGKKKRKTHR